MIGFDRQAARGKDGRGEAKPGPDGSGSGNGNGSGPRPEFRLVVIGASAGGVEALMRLVGQLPGNFPAAVLVVLHIQAHTESFWPQILSRSGSLPAAQPVSGDELAPGRIYVAPPDHHLLVEPGRVILSRGPTENQARPAVDPLFRTAANAYGPWVIGVVLSGSLDDGTFGAMEIKRRGGIVIAQDPKDAAIPSMPTSVIENVEVDHVVSLEEMGPLLVRLARRPVGKTGEQFMLRKRTGSDVAEVGTDALASDPPPGPPSSFTCPQCGGALWELMDGKLVRYRCHVGHGYTPDGLLSAQGQRVEEALWAGLRALEETVAMQRRMAQRARRSGWARLVERYEARAQEAEQRAGQIRAVLVEERPCIEVGEAVEEHAKATRDLTQGSKGKMGGRKAPGKRRGRRVKGET